MRLSKIIWIVFLIVGLFSLTFKTGYAQVLASPTLQSPSNGADDRPIELTLDWNSVTGATSYQVQVSTSQDFSNLIVDQSGITGTSLDISGLDYETTYYWRVRATNGVTTSNWSEVWSFTTVPAPPEAPALNAPSDGANEVSTQPLFDWDPVQNADSYQIQVSTDSEFSTLEINESNLTSASYQATGLSNSTVYFWRIRAVNAGGQSDWSVVWGFTTESSSDGSNEPPVHPTLASPSNGATGISVNRTLSWNSVQNADTYRLQLAIDSGFSSVVTDSAGISSTNLDVSGLSNSTTYYWRVLATNENGNSDWSSSWSFTTEASASNPPEAPMLASPSNGADEISTNPNLEWNASDKANSYHIQVATDANFNTLVVNESGLSSTSYQASGLDNATTYYWRVRASNSGGDSDWSSTWSFTTRDQPQSPPATPNLAAPSDGASGVSTSPLLDWNSADRAESYRIQLTEDTGFNSLVTDSSDITATELQLQGLSNSTTYYWRVQASNSAGNSSWSNSWSFITESSSDSGEAPNPPQLVSPENGATQISTSPLLDWDPSETADTYDFQIATDQNFQSIVVNLQDVTSTHYEADLEGSTTYYWRVKAKNENGASPWSDPWNFSTQNEGNAITIIDPTTKAFWQAPNNYTIRWETTNQISTVRIEYSTDDGQNWNLIAEQVNASENIYEWDVPNTTLPFARIKITDEENQDNFAISPSFIIYPNTLQLDRQFSFSSSPSQSDYKLIALPAETNIPLDQVFTGSYGDDWRAYHDNGSVENYLEEYDRSEKFNFKPGRGFWIINQGNASINEQTPVVDLNADTAYTIPLHNGWNIIGSPFHSAVTWGTVQEANNLDDPLWSFNGSFTENNVLKPYTGYYFFNRNNLSELTIPYKPEIETNAKPQTESVDHQKIVTLAIYKDGQKKSSIRFGVDPSVAHKPSNRFQPAPPGDFQDYKLTLQPTKLEDTPYPLAEIRRASFDDMKELTLQLKNKARESITLEAEGLDHIRPYRIALVHQQTGKTYNLDANNTIRTSFNQPLTNLKIVVGTPQEIEKQQQHTKPTELTLSQNYPNPFNGQTVIEYSVPEHMGQTEVNLSVFDILGRKVYTLQNGQKQPGFYEVRWNGDNDTGRSLASGIYYYRLIVGQSVITKKLTLIK